MSFHTGLLIPFKSLPRKDWKHDSEVQERVPEHLYMSESEDEKEIDYSAYFPDSDDDNSEYDSDDDDSVQSDDMFTTIQKQIKELLPGEVVNGKKGKEASSAHLHELKVPPSTFKFCYYYNELVRMIKDWRAMDRARRKHHLLKEFEKQVYEYDLKQKENIENEIAANRKRVILEAYRSIQRTKRNSVVKVNKKAIVEEYSRALHRRDLEATKCNFYSGPLAQWGVDGKFRQDAEKERAARQAVTDEEEFKEAEKLRIRNETVSNDNAILEEDRQLTKKVDTIMVQYGMIEYTKNYSKNQEKFIDELNKANQTLQKKKSMKMIVPTDDDDDPTFLLVKLKSHRHDDLIEIRNNLKSKKYKKKVYESPFADDLFLDTGDVLTMQCVNLGEVGALALAAEFSKGSCPILETLILKDCYVTTQGLCRILQGIKASNLSTIHTLNLRHNFLGPNSISFLKELLVAGIFMNLKVLNLAENELKDEGVSRLCEAITGWHFTGLKELHIQRNSITDHGFAILMRFIKSVKEVFLPGLQRLGVENNLVTVEARDLWKPYPGYLSY